MAQKKTYKDPLLPRWGVRRFYQRGGGPNRELFTVGWHSADPKPSKYLIAQGLTQEQARLLAKVLQRKGLELS